MSLSFDHRLALAIILVVAAISGIVYLIFSQPVQTRDEGRAIITCTFLCKGALNQGMNLDDGPCLSSGSDAWEVRSWVCDIAHWPRQGVDSLPENQCPEFGVTATHFVELDPECGFIRVG